MNIFTIIIGFLAYIIGAFPTGYLIAQLKGITDIRKHGSGNIGATNIARVLGKKYFFLIFFLDAGKAYLFITMIKNYFDFNYLCFFAGILLLGNCYSIFLQGSGGKGIATLCGLLSVLYPQASLFLLGIWLITLLFTHTVGIASIVATVFLPIYVYMTTDNNAFFLFLIHRQTPLYLFALFAAGLVLWKHRSNIQAYWNKR